MGLLEIQGATTATDIWKPSSCNVGGNEEELCPATLHFVLCFSLPFSLQVRLGSGLGL